MNTRGLTAKQKVALRTLAECAPLLALFYADKKVQGLLIAQKNKHTGGNLAPIMIDKDDDDIETESFKTEKTIGALLGGVGHYGEFQRLKCLIEEDIVSEEVDLFGTYPGITERVTEEISEVLGDEFRSKDMEVPYRVELVFIGLMEEGLQMYRVKYDGDFHPAVPFCILGGYETVNGGESLRHRALALLDQAYEGKKMPTLRQAKKLAQTIMRMSSFFGTYKDATFSWKR